MPKIWKSRNPKKLEFIFAQVLLFLAKYIMELVWCEISKFLSVKFSERALYTLLEIWNFNLEETTFLEMQESEVIKFSIYN